MLKENLVTVSIVTHGHGQMTRALIDSILKCPEVALIILTVNIPEALSLPQDHRLKVIRNTVPQGFGENHNVAFQYNEANFFCVLNPDITLIGNPFTPLIADLFQDPSLGLLAPLVKNIAGEIEDSARPFLSISGLIRRNIFSQNDAYVIKAGSPILFPAWVAGMCLLFRREVYQALGGFDSRYFLYVEDVDICTRAWQAGYRVALDPRVAIIHDAQRSTLRKWSHFYWHLSGIIRYIYKFTGRYPDLPSV